MKLERKKKTSQLSDRKVYPDRFFCHSVYALSEMQGNSGPLFLFVFTFPSLPDVWKTQDVHVVQLGSSEMSD